MALPTDYQDAYQAFANQLECLMALVTLAECDRCQLKIAADQLQQLFQSQILTLSSAGAHLPQSLQSLQVEIDKQLRLLNMDLLFWQSAHRPETRQQRQTQMQNRLTLLGQYCAAVLVA
jgi:hypothetical protein